MRKLLVPAALVVAIAMGGAAAASAHAAKHPANPKHADCVKQWSAEKKHTETRKAFLAACERA